jgi:hypothetical protein
MINEIVRKGSKVSTTYKVKTNRTGLDEVKKDIICTVGTNKSVSISVVKS